MATNLQCYKQPWETLGVMIALHGHITAKECGATSLKCPVEQKMFTYDRKCSLVHQKSDQDGFRNQENDFRELLPLSP